MAAAPELPSRPTADGRRGLPSLGGLQFASDVFWCADWRIQRLAFSGRHRLLDPHQRVRARGSLERCRAAFAALEPSRSSAPAPPLVLLLHGLGRTRRSLRVLRSALLAAGFEVGSLSCASTRAPLVRHVADLGAVLAGLAPRRVSFVTHSLGAIVLRAALARGGEWSTRLELGRAVLMAAPNQGSALSRRLAAHPLARHPFRWFAGPTAIELGRAGQQLPPPPLPFALIAGARGTPKGWNPLLAGDDDGIVTVAETRLPGAADHLVVRALHTWMMSKPAVVEATTRFLLEGRLRAGPRVEDPTWIPDLGKPPLGHDPGRIPDGPNRTC